MSCTLSDVWTGFHNSDSKIHFESLIHCIEEGRFLSGKKDATLQEIISFINNSLNSAKNRLEGLCLLKVLLQQCKHAVFSENVLTWLQLLISLLKPYERGSAIKMMCDLVCDMMKRCVTSPELSRQVSHDVIPQLIPALLSAQEQWLSSSLQCLICCIQSFSGACGPFKNKISGLVTSLFESSNSVVQRLACQCYAVLPRCGGGGNNGIKHTEAWTEQFANLMSASSETVYELYRNVTNDLNERETLQCSLLGLKALDICEPHRSFALQKRYATLCQCLCNMMSEEFTAIVKIPVEEVFNVVCDTLAVTGKSLSSATKERSYVLAVLPLVHTSTLQVLGCLISCTRSLLLPYGDTVVRLLTQILRWTKATRATHANSKCYSNLRIQVYRVLSDWLTVAGSASCVGHSADDLVQNVIIDSTPDTAEVKLQSGNRNTTHESGQSKKKRKIQNSFSDNIGQFTAHNDSSIPADRELCVAALQALRKLLTCYGSELEPKHAKQVQNFLIPLVLRVQSSSWSSLYSHATCRHSLYAVLRACVQSPSVKWPAPIHCAVPIFSKGIQDPDLEVSGFCYEALLACENLIHARMPVFHTSSAGHINSHQTMDSVFSSVETQNVYPTNENHDQGSNRTADDTTLDRDQPSTSHKEETIEVNSSEESEGSNDEEEADDDMESKSDDDVEVLSEDSVECVEEVDIGLSDESGSRDGKAHKKDNDGRSTSRGGGDETGSKAGTKRKHSDDETEDKNDEDDQTEMTEADGMLLSFVDAGPDSE